MVPQPEGQGDTDREREENQDQDSDYPAVCHPGNLELSEDIHGTISRTPQGWGLIPVASTPTVVVWRFARDTPQEVCDPLSEQGGECQDGNQKFCRILHTSSPCEGPALAICAVGNSIEQPLCQPMNMGTCVVECHAELECLKFQEN